MPSDDEFVEESVLEEGETEADAIPDDADESLEDMAEQDNNAGVDGREESEYDEEVVDDENGEREAKTAAKAGIVWPPPGRTGSSMLGGRAAAGSYASRVNQKTAAAAASDSESDSAEEDVSADINLSASSGVLASTPGSSNKMFDDSSEGSEGSDDSDDAAQAIMAAKRQVRERRAQLAKQVENESPAPSPTAKSLTGSVSQRVAAVWSSDEDEDLDVEKAESQKSADDVAEVLPDVVVKEPEIVNAVDETLEEQAQRRLRRRLSKSVLDDQENQNKLNSSQRRLSLRKMKLDTGHNIRKSSKQTGGALLSPLGSEATIKPKYRGRTPDEKRVRLSSREAGLLDRTGHSSRTGTRSSQARWRKRVKTLQSHQEQPDEAVPMISSIRVTASGETRDRITQDSEEEYHQGPDFDNENDSEDWSDEDPAIAVHSVMDAMDFQTMVENNILADKHKLAALKNSAAADDTNQKFTSTSGYVPTMVADQIGPLAEQHRRVMKGLGKTLALEARASLVGGLTPFGGKGDAAKVFTEAVRDLKTEIDLTIPKTKLAKNKSKSHSSLGFRDSKKNVVSQQGTVRGSLWLGALPRLLMLKDSVPPNPEFWRRLSALDSTVWKSIAQLEESAWEQMVQGMFVDAMKDFKQAVELRESHCQGFVQEVVPFLEKYLFLCNIFALELLKKESPGSAMKLLEAALEVTLPAGVEFENYYVLRWLTLHSMATYYKSRKRLREALRIMKRCEKVEARFTPEIRRNLFLGNKKSTSTALTLIHKGVIATLSSNRLLAVQCGTDAVRLLGALESMHPELSQEEVMAFNGVSTGKDAPSALWRIIPPPLLRTICSQLPPIARVRSLDSVDGPNNDVDSQINSDAGSDSGQKNSSQSQAHFSINAGNPTMFLQETLSKWTPFSVVTSEVFTALHNLAREHEGACKFSLSNRLGIQAVSTAMLRWPAPDLSPVRTSSSKFSHSGRSKARLATPGFSSIYGDGPLPQDDRFQGWSKSFKSSLRRLVASVSSHMSTADLISGLVECGVPVVMSTEVARWGAQNCDYDDEIYDDNQSFDESATWDNVSVMSSSRSDPSGMGVARVPLRKRLLSPLIHESTKYKPPSQQANGGSSRESAKRPTHGIHSQSNSRRSTPSSPKIARSFQDVEHNVILASRAEAQRSNTPSRYQVSPKNLKKLPSLQPNTLGLQLPPEPLKQQFAKAKVGPKPPGVVDSGLRKVGNSLNPTSLVDLIPMEDDTLDESKLSAVDQFDDEPWSDSDGEEQITLSAH